MSNIRDTIGEIHNYGIDVKNREIYLHSAKDGGEEDPGVDYRMAINFVKNIRHLDSLNSDEINCFIIFSLINLSLTYLR